jgi:hypothetical protein
MIPTTLAERQWLLRNLARGLADHLGAVEPPVAVEELHRHPPELFDADFGVVDMYSHLWDATFARMPSKRGSVFVRIDLPDKDRRFSLARETLTALVTSAHGRALGLPELLLDSLRESAEYFARHLLAPEPMVQAYRARSGEMDGFGDAFGVPDTVADLRWRDPPLIQVH